MNNIDAVYEFVDKTGKCFDAFARVSDETDYHKRIAAAFRAGTQYEFGDMTVFRDDLVEAGFEWGKDFYVRKIRREHQ